MVELFAQHPIEVVARFPVRLIESEFELVFRVRHLGQAALRNLYAIRAQQERGLRETVELAQFIGIIVRPKEKVKRGQQLDPAIQAYGGQDIAGVFAKPIQLLIEARPLLQAVEIGGDFKNLRKSFSAEVLDLVQENALVAKSIALAQQLQLDLLVEREQIHFPAPFHRRLMAQSPREPAEEALIEIFFELDVERDQIILAQQGLFEPFVLLFKAHFDRSDPLWRKGARKQGGAAIVDLFAIDQYFVDLLALYFQLAVLQHLKARYFFQHPFQGLIEAIGPMCHIVDNRIFLDDDRRALAHHLGTFQIMGFRFQAEVHFNRGLPAVGDH